MDAAANESLRIGKLGMAALKKEDLRKAAALFAQAVKIDTDNCEARIRLAEIHLKLKQPEAAVADLRWMIEPHADRVLSYGSDPGTRMLYTLALLDSYRWEDAAACYNGSIKPDLTWSLPGSGPEHTFPAVRFEANTPDFPGMRAQAHLILGARQTAFIDCDDTPDYMLPHIEEVLRIFPGSLDARFLKAVLLAKMDRYDEARKAFAVASKNAPKPALDEIKAELAKMEEREALKKAYQAKLAAKPAKP